MRRAASMAASLCLAIVTISLAAATSDAAPVATATVPAFGGGPVKGCAKFRLDLDVVSGLQVDAKLRARCFDGKRIALRWTSTYTDESGSAMQVVGSGRLLGRSIEFSGQRNLATSGQSIGSIAIAIPDGPTVAGEDGEGPTSVVGGTIPVSTSIGPLNYGLVDSAYLSVRSTNYNCLPDSSTRGGVTIATMGFGDTHYHGTPSARDRRGLPWALCVTALQVTNDYHRMGSWPPSLD